MNRCLPMDFFTSTLLAIPMVQLVLMILFSTVALLFQKVKLALLVNYMFTLYWGYFLNRDLILAGGMMSDTFGIVYFSFGLVVVIFAMVGFLQNR